jgi:hypothetical protein
MKNQFHYLSETDHTRPSWVIFSPVSKRPVKRVASQGVPSTVNALLGHRREIAMHIKPAYSHLQCCSCGRYDSYRIFDVGFDDDVTINIKGDFGHTNDRIFVVTQKFLDVLRNAHTTGYEVKRIGTTGWYALRITLFVDSNDSVIKTSGAACSECGNPEECWGIHLRLSDLRLPSTADCLFTTKKGWPSAPFFDRSIFMSERIAKLLKEGGIAGGYCKRLLTDDEWNWVEDFRKKGIPKDVPATTVYLSSSLSRRRPSK